MHDTDRVFKNLSTVSVIVPTTCSSPREPLINRAIESILTQTGIDLEVLVIANGNHIDEKLIGSLERNSRLQVVRLTQGNVSAARYAGVERAKSEYFCFLDDDDEYLPGALKKRVDLFQTNSLADVIVTNGFEHLDGEDVIFVKAEFIEEILDNQGRSFLKKNWFASPAALFRSNSVSPRLFDFNLKYFEWTYLFFLLTCENIRFHFDESLTYRKHEDNTLSISKSAEYAMAHPEFLLTLLKFPLEPELQHIINDKYISALNGLSNFELRRGNRWAAWKAHLKCLGNGGWKYLPYTRRFVLP